MESHHIISDIQFHVSCFLAKKNHGTIPFPTLDMDNPTSLFSFWNNIHNYSLKILECFLLFCNPHSLLIPSSITLLSNGPTQIMWPLSQNPYLYMYTVKNFNFDLGMSCSLASPSVQKENAKISTLSFSLVLTLEKGNETSKSVQPQWFPLLT